VDEAESKGLNCRWTRRMILGVLAQEASLFRDIKWLQWRHMNKIYR
jgi:hypothetical protein